DDATAPAPGAAAAAAPALGAELDKPLPDSGDDDAMADDPAAAGADDAAGDPAEEPAAAGPADVAPPADAPPDAAPPDNGPPATGLAGPAIWLSSRKPGGICAWASRSVSSRCAAVVASPRSTTRLPSMRSEPSWRSRIIALRLPSRDAHSAYHC